MGDYIRGKAAYTKWDADGEAENIDIEYRPNGEQTPPQEGWLSGRKGRVIKILLLLILFSAGLMVGYLLRRGIGLRDVFYHGHSSHHYHYLYSEENADKLQAEIKAENIRNFLRNYTSEPHIAGKPASQQYVNYTEELWRSWGLDDVKIEKFSVLLSYPSSNEANRVHLVSANDSTVTHAFASEIGDDAGIHPDLRPYLAYSPNMTARGKLVYANYGQKEDFEYLLSQNITINGSIVIMRLGKLHRANKVKFAEDYNATGALLYPDPADYVHDNKSYPHGVDLPGDSVIRGSLSLKPGDPQTPMQASTDNAFHEARWRLNLPQIPVQPISYNNAQKFLAEMDGPDAPLHWQGKLPITYKLGPGHIVNNSTDWMVTMDIYNELRQTDIYNLIGAIIGKYEPDRYIIVGNHYDSWTNGTGDPGTGLAAFMELVRAFGRLKAGGWKPGRTIIFALWDAEEFGMIGSTEWLQRHNKELASRAIAYINTDAGIQGRDILQAFGSPLLKRVVHEASNIVSFPVEDGQHSKSVFTQWKSLSGIDNLFDLNSGPTLGILGYGSDYAAFMSMYGISSLHLQFVSKNDNSSYPLYHSAHDNFEAIADFIDPDFEISQTLAKLVGIVVLKLSDSLSLPMDIEDYGRALKDSFATFNATYGPVFQDVGLSLDKIEKAVEDLHLATRLTHNDFSFVNQKDELLTYHECNDQVLEFERAFTVPHWELPMVPLRHVVFGPHPYNIEEGIAFPLLVDAILKAEGSNESALVDRIRREVAQVIQALESAAGVLEHSIFSFYEHNLKETVV